MFVANLQQHCSSKGNVAAAAHRFLYHLSQWRSTGVDLRAHLPDKSCQWVQRELSRTVPIPVDDPRPGFPASGTRTLLATRSLREQVKEPLMTENCLGKSMWTPSLASDFEFWPILVWLLRSCLVYKRLMFEHVLLAEVLCDLRCLPQLRPRSVLVPCLNAD